MVTEQVDKEAEDDNLKLEKIVRDQAQGKKQSLRVEVNRESLLRNEESPSLNSLEGDNHIGDENDSNQ